METFSADWLALREPADHAARDAGLTGRAAEWLRSLGRPARAIDLACGSGSNVRYLLPRLPQGARTELGPDLFHRLEGVVHDERVHLHPCPGQRPRFSPQAKPRMGTTCPDARAPRPGGRGHGKTGALANGGFRIHGPSWNRASGSSARTAASRWKW